jgi:hypothetical protein
MSDRKIIDYKTITADNTEALDAKISRALAQGFQPYGNPYLSDNKIQGRVGDLTVTQAMVKYQDKE